MLFYLLFFLYNFIETIILTNPNTAIIMKFIKLSPVLGVVDSAVTFPLSVSFSSDVSPGIVGFVVSGIFS